MSLKRVGIAIAVLAAGCGGSGGGGGDPPGAGPAPAEQPLPSWSAELTPVPMAGVDIRRTGQSAFVGPPSAASVWTYTAAGGAAINIQAVVTSQGAFFGTWGLARKDPALNPDQWDKGDGRYYGLSLQGTELFSPLRPALVPGGYLDAARPRLSRDDYFMPGTDYHVTYYNGTIEGAPCIDPVSGLHYVGRGDGRLYAIDPATGAVAWSFATFNPQDPDEDGGGEILGGPVLGRGRVIYFGTAGLPWPESDDNPCYETNAVYAVSSDGELLWRYPSSAARLDNWVAASPALSPDGRTLYVGTFAGDPAVPGRLIALDLTRPASASDAERVRWDLTLRNTARAGNPAVWVRSIVVGADGRVYVGGAEAQFLGSSPVVFAVDPDGSFAWSPTFTEPQGYPAAAQWPGGLALRESGTPVLFVSTTHNRSENGTGGVLIALIPANGLLLDVFDPSLQPTPGAGGMTGPALGADGTIYAGIRGKHPTATVPGVNGRMYAVDFDGLNFAMLWEYEVDGQIDWATPSIGADGGLYFGTTDDRENGTWLHSLFDPWFDTTEIPVNSSPKFYGIRWRTVDVPGTFASVRVTAPGDSGDVWRLGDDAANLTSDIDVHENVSFALDGTVWFSRQTGGDGATSELWRMAADGTSQVRLTNDATSDQHPTVSPDGQKVVWWSDRSGVPHLWIMDTDGTDPVELTTGADATFDPEFSPDGTMVAYNRSPDGGLHADIWIGVLNASRTAFQDTWSLTSRGYVATEVDPTWSPDMTRIAYSSYDGPGRWTVEGIDPANGLVWRLYDIEVNLTARRGENRRVLVDAVAEADTVSWLPCYSADGGQLAFIRSTFNPAAWPGPYPFGTASSRLCVSNADGTGTRTIEGTSGCYWFDWRR